MGAKHSPHQLSLKNRIFQKIREILGKSNFSEISRNEDLNLQILVFFGTYGTVHMPTAHMSTDGCEALSASAFPKKWCEALSGTETKCEKSRSKVAGVNFVLNH